MAFPLTSPSPFAQKLWFFFQAGVDERSCKQLLLRMILWAGGLGWLVISPQKRTRSTNPVAGKFAQVVSLDLYGMAPAKTTSGGSQVGRVIYVNNHSSWVLFHSGDGGAQGQLVKWWTWWSGAMYCGKGKPYASCIYEHHLGFMGLTQEFFVVVVLLVPLRFFFEGFAPQKHRLQGYKMLLQIWQMSFHMFQFWSRKRSSEGSNWWNTACNSKLASYVIHAFCRVSCIAGVAGFLDWTVPSFSLPIVIQWGSFMWLMCNFPCLTPRLPNNCFTMFGVGVHLCTSKPKVFGNRTRQVYGGFGFRVRDTQWLAVDSTSCCRGRQGCSGGAEQSESESERCRNDIQSAEVHGVGL